MEAGYVYRFLDKDMNILYVGKTKNILQRMLQHKNYGHLTPDQYKQVSKIQVMKLPTYNDAGLCERYFISKYKPLFNQSMTNEGDVTIVLQINYEWEDYDIDLCNTLKDKKVRNKSNMNFERILNNVCMIDTTGHTFILYKLNHKPVEYLYCSKDEFRDSNNQIENALWMPEELVSDFLESANTKGIPIVYGFLLSDNGWQRKCKELWSITNKNDNNELNNFNKKMEELTSECHFINLNKLLKHPELDNEYRYPDYREEVRLKVNEYINSRLIGECR